MPESKPCGAARRQASGIVRETAKQQDHACEWRGWSAMARTRKRSANGAKRFRRFHVRGAGVMPHGGSPLCGPHDSDVHAAFLTEGFQCKPQSIYIRHRWASCS